jgi:hypothetical protein
LGFIPLAYKTDRQPASQNSRLLDSGAMARPATRLSPPSCFAYVFLFVGWAALRCSQPDAPPLAPLYCDDFQRNLGAWAVDQMAGGFVMGWLVRS